MQHGSMSWLDMQFIFYQSSMYWFGSLLEEKTSLLYGYLKFRYNSVTMPLVWRRYTIKPNRAAIRDHFTRLVLVGVRVAYSKIQRFSE